MYSSDSDDEDKYLLALFSKFPCNERIVTPEKAESKLKSSFQLLNNEVFDFRFPVKVQMPSGDEFEMYVTNWALRTIFIPLKNKPVKYHNFIIPLKSIIRITKKNKTSIKFHFSSGSHLTIDLPEIEGIRTAFINRIHHLKKNVLHFDSKSWIPNPSWIYRLISKEPHYDLLSNLYCNSYPSYFLLPKNVPSYFIRQSSHCRSRERFPILTYVYNSDIENLEDKIYLLRSSQPLNILTKSKSDCEHEYLAAVCGSHGLSIIDCRPQKNAFAYELIGKGYESTADIKKFIPDVSFHFLGIQHAYKTRERYVSMMRKIFHGKSRPYKKWGKRIMQLLRKSSFVVNNIISLSRSVLVHCSDGWDRTSQICSLTQIMIDPFYRTLKGFIELIQKDWIDMGHMFCSRCAHVQSENFDEKSPIFAQFIDSVAQLLNKYQKEFEFNLLFLQLILSSAYSQLFGDFLGNNYTERLSMRRPTSLFLCFEDDKFGFADKIRNENYIESQQILKIKKSDNYKFFSELMGTPAFFCENVPLIKTDPPFFPDFRIDEFEQISSENEKERENDEELKKILKKHKKEESTDSDEQQKDDFYDERSESSSTEDSSSRSSSDESEDSNEDSLDENNAENIERNDDSGERNDDLKGK